MLRNGIMKKNCQVYVPIILTIFFLLSPIFEYQLYSLRDENSVKSLKRKPNPGFQYTLVLKNNNEFKEKNPDNKFYFCSHLDNYHLNKILIHILLERPFRHIKKSTEGHSARSPTFI